MFNRYYYNVLEYNMEKETKKLKARMAFQDAKKAMVLATK